MKKPLRSKVEIYEALGGVEGIAAITKAKPKQADWWLRYADQLPAHSYVALTRALKRKRLKAVDTLWAMKGLD